ncbi:MAG: sigma-70 family RNA polymerase sigma factor [Myxococcaceae bacterium]|nr:sigma-70 family RNA polymerase sigma factor [Myxococcaceae bacterium]
MAWDRQLLMGFREGAPDALAEVFRQNAELLTRRLRAAAWRGRGFERLRSELELENAVLEVFARAFEPRARGVYDGVRPFEHFLMGIARNFLLEEARIREHSAGINRELEEQVERVLMQDAPVDAEQELVDRELEGLLEQFKRSLSPEELQLFDLRFTQELGQEEAAARIGLSRIQLRRRELALKKLLLEFLKERGYLRGLEAAGWTFVRRSTGS